MEKDACDHCEGEAIGEVGVWQGDDFISMEHCYCPDCGEDFVFPFDSRTAML